MPIPTNLFALIASGVPTMAPPPYNFAYGPVDVFDPAAWIPARPQVFLEESGWDLTPGSQRVNSLAQSGLFTFRAIVPKGPGASDVEMNKVDSDIKRLMQALNESLRAAGMLPSSYQGTKKAYRLVDAYPGEVRVNYVLAWRQDRQNPEST